jgi:lysine-N-methylase
MTTTKGRIAKIPRYLQQFKCIGADCPDTCCSGWQVDIDKATFKKLRNLESGELATKVRKHIAVVPEPTGKSYARVKLDEKLHCPMLTDTMLCSIQQEVGADHLSMVCRDYPRQYTAVGANETQLLASLSCPEAAKLCLLDRQGWALTDQPLNIPMGKEVPYIAGNKDNLKNSADYKARNFDLLQNFALEVVQYRGLAMWQRLLLVGLVCERLELLDQTLPQSEVDRHVEHLVLKGKLAMLDGSFNQQTQGMTPNLNTIKAQQVFIKRMNDERLLMSTVATGEVRLNTAFATCMAEAFIGLEYETNNLEATAQKLQEASAGFSEFEAAHPYILENFFSNNLALDVFPIAKSKVLTEQWHDLMIRYAMVRFYLIGMSAKHGENFSVDHCVKLIYSYSKTVQHNKLFLPRIHAFLSQENLNSLATMAILVR